MAAILGPRSLYAPFALLLTFSFASLSFSGEFRTIDGSGNNLANPNWGRAESELIRLFDPVYQDGISVPRGDDPSNLPSARLISNVVSDQTSSVTNFLGASDWLWQWGQFLDHDMDFTPTGVEPFSIAVPKLGDPDFNPFQMDGVTMPFARSQAAVGTGTSPSNPRQQMNEISSYIDGSVIYGSSASRAAALRMVSDSAMLETSLANNGEILPMKNSVGQPNEVGGSPFPTDFYLSGDVRANEQIGLMAAHSLFVREHNRLVTELRGRLTAGEAALIAKRDQAIADISNNVNDENDFLYESVRKLVGAQIQQITYEEFLPMLIGNELGAYAGYDSGVNASVSNEFASAAYRLGHTLLSPEIKRPGVGTIALKDAFFNPGEVQANGIDAVLLGLAQQQAQELDHMLVDGVRNFLFGPPGAGGLDLAALNIQRGRDHGLPSYVETHNELFGSSITDFSDLGSAGLGLIDDSVVALLEQAYDTVDQIDLWIGGISESPAVHGGLLGPTYTQLIADQFSRSRDGDRFFYLDDSTLEHLELIDPNFQDTLLSDIIMRNSTIASLQANVFLAIPEPTSAALVLGAAFWLTSRRRMRS